MIRWLSVSASLRTASTSFFTIRPTGMPVQSATTAATAWPSTVGRISGDSPCSFSSSLCSFFSLAEQLSRGRLPRVAARRQPAWPRSLRRRLSPFARSLVGGGFQLASGAFDLAGRAAELGPDFQDLIDELLFVLPALVELARAGSFRWPASRWLPSRAW